jgi:hypothetical protein
MGTSTKCILITPDKCWAGIIKLGQVDNVDIFYDQYHPAQTLTVELSRDKREILYIIGPYDDILIYEGIRKNIIVSEKPTTLEKKITYNNQTIEYYE